MRPLEKRWHLRSPDPPLQGKLSRELGLSPAVAQILINRGIRDREQGNLFLSPRLDHLPPPREMKDMDAAVERIVRALERKEKLAIYGDYDVDGVTATSLLLLFFQELGVQAEFYIPDRAREGYGLRGETITRFRERGITLVITVDCGISDREALELARANGVDVIVTDHHEPPEQLPPACALLNPKRAGDPFPFKGLAGVGIALYLAMGVRTRLRESGGWGDGREPNLRSYLDLVALGTIADVAPMEGVNRILVKFGLEEMGRRDARPGIRALKEVSGVAEGPVDASQVAFRLGPRLNAAGRLGRGDIGVHLLTAQQIGEARPLAHQLDRENTRRQQLEEELLRDVEVMIAAQPELLAGKSLVLGREGWPVGLLGLAASRLVEAYYRPTVLISFEGDRGRGSARSIPSFHLYQGIKGCAPMLEGFGGHAMAAGLALCKENLEGFRRRFEEIASPLTEADLTPALHLDARLGLPDLSEALILELHRLAPFGPGNPEPLFEARGLQVVESRLLGNSRSHLRLKLHQDGLLREAIGFGLGHLFVRHGDRVDLAFEATINEWQGRRTVQLRLRDLKVASLRE